MTSLVCRIGCTSDVVNPGKLFDDFDFIPRFFQRETNSNVAIKIDATPLRQPFDFAVGGAVDAFSLHTMVRKLTRNSLYDRPVNKITLIIARSYSSNEAAFGMMFDEGYVHDGDLADDVVEAEVLGPPREGCAIFIDAIAAKRGKRGSAAFGKELKFTALHELGHVFNLQHQDGGSNIMKRSAVHGIVPRDGLKLSSADRVRLSQDPLPYQYHPGGSEFGGGASANAPLVWQFIERNVSLDLQMRLQTSHNEAHGFEPIELDVEISLTPGVRRRQRIRNMVDPGYDSFRIWIEDPNGARRTLRSPRRYCGTAGWLTITRDRPFRRDISIGRQAGGPVFRQAGTHHIWGEMNLGARGMLRSNRVPLRIKDLSKISVPDAAARSFLESVSGVVLCYSRLWCGSMDVRRRAMKLVTEFPNESWSPLLRYSILRAANSAAVSQGGVDPTNRFKKALCKLAADAAEDPFLGEHRVCKVLEVLNTNSH